MGVTDSQRCLARNNKSTTGLKLNFENKQIQTHKYTNTQTHNYKYISRASSPTEVLTALQRLESDRPDRILLKACDKLSKTSAVSTLIY